MSTEYQLAPGLFAVESSSMIEIYVEDPRHPYCEVTHCPRMDERQLRTAIIKLVEVLSYVSDDPDEALARFNVNYGDTV